jgi:hypothetical protein
MGLMSVGDSLFKTALLATPLLREQTFTYHFLLIWKRCLRQA